MLKSKKKIDLSIVIPSYNEFKNLGSLFNKIKLISKKIKKQKLFQLIMDQQMVPKIT